MKILIGTFLVLVASVFGQIPEDSTLQEVIAARKVIMESEVAFAKMPHQKALSDALKAIEEVNQTFLKSVTNDKYAEFHEKTITAVEVALDTLANLLKKDRQTISELNRKVRGAIEKLEVSLSGIEAVLKIQVDSAQQKLYELKQVATKSNLQAGNLLRDQLRKVFEKLTEAQASTEDFRGALPWMKILQSDRKLLEEFCEKVKKKLTALSAAMPPPIEPPKK